MRRAWVIAVAVLATLAVAAGLVGILVLANRDRLGLGGPLPPLAAPEQVIGGEQPRQAEDPDLGTLDIYDVDEDGALVPAATGAAGLVWDAFSRVATRDFTAEVMLTYETGDAPDSTLLAYVYQDDERPEYWHLAANVAPAADMSYLLTTLIHEYAHILTLDLGQQPAERSCEPAAPSQDCWYEDSYLMAFWEEFWSGYGENAPAWYNDDDDVTETFYAAHEEDFVSSYSAKSVREDIAESFMAYVIEPVPDPSDSTVAAKLAFFERYPELAAIRERIRAEFGEQLQPVWDP